MTAVYTATCSRRPRRATSGRTRCCRRTSSSRRSLAGAAALLPVARWLEPAALAPLAGSLGGAALVHSAARRAARSRSPHPTAHARLARREMTRGRYRLILLAGVAARRSSPCCAALARRAPRAARARRAARSRARVRAGWAVGSARIGEPTMDAKPLPRVRAAVGDRVARRDVLSRSQPHPPRRVSAEGALGRLGGARLEARGRERVERRYMLVPTPASTASPPAGCSPTSTRDARGPQVRGQPRASRLARAQLRQGTGDAQPGQRSRPHPLSRSSAPATRGEGKWEQRVAGTRRSTTSPRASAGRSSRGGRTRSCTTSAGPARTATPSACSPPGASTATTRTPTSARSSGAPATTTGWGFDRPSPDHANAEVILLISAHLETGHYFNPHAQRIIEAKAHGAKLIVFDTRLSNTATHADYWLAPYPGSGGGDPAGDREPPDPNAAATTASSCAAGGTGRSICRDASRTSSRRSRASRRARASSTPSYTFEFAGARIRRRRPTRSREIAEVVAQRRHAALDPQLAQRRGGQPRRLAGRRARSSSSTRCSARSRPRAARTPTPGTSSCRGRSTCPPHPQTWNELNWPHEYPLGDERAVVPAAALPQGRARAARRVLHPRLQPGLDQPRRLLVDRGADRRGAVGLHVALTPTWSETAYFADYMLPMGHRLRAPRPPLLRDARRAVARLPPARAARGARAARRARRRHARREPGRGVGGERVLDRALLADRSRRRAGHPQVLRVRRRPGEKLTVDEYYGYIFENSVPGLPERAARGGPDAARVHAPLRRLRDRTAASGALHEERVPDAELDDCASTTRPRLHAGAEARVAEYRAAADARIPTPTAGGAVGVEIDGRIAARVSDAERAARVLLATLADWGWPEYALPTYIRSHIHPDDSRAGRDASLIPTFRLPVQIHTRSANAKWLDEIAHTNPLWIHPVDAARLGAANRRSRARRDRDRPLRRQGVGDRGHPSGRGRLQPSHGALEDSAARAASGR